MITKIIKELTVIKKSYEITSEQVLSWAKRVEVHRTQTEYSIQQKKRKNFT